MPTVLVVFGFRFVIYLNDHKPPHVHVKKAGCELVVELKTGKVIKNKGNLFKSSEIPGVVALVKKYEEILDARWREIHEKEIK